MTRSKDRPKTKDLRGRSKEWRMACAGLALAGVAESRQLTVISEFSC